MVGMKRKDVERQLLAALEMSRVEAAAGAFRDDARVRGRRLLGGLKTPEK
jgi:hypothetical protein